VEQVRTVNAALSATLAQWAYNYDLEAFIRLFRENPGIDAGEG